MVFGFVGKFPPSENPTHRSYAAANKRSHQENNFRVADNTSWIRLIRRVRSSQGNRPSQGGIQTRGEKQLTGQETEPWEIIYFKVYKSQLPVIEQALETAGLMLGNDKSRGYCLEMICADFLAGATLESGEPRSPTAACSHESGLATAHQESDAKTNL